MHVAKKNENTVGYFFPSLEWNFRFAWFTCCETASFFLSCSVQNRNEWQSSRMDPLFHEKKWNDSDEGPTMSWLKPCLTIVHRSQCAQIQDWFAYFPSSLWLLMIIPSFPVGKAKIFTSAHKPTPIMERYSSADSQDISVYTRPLIKPIKIET